MHFSVKEVKKSPMMIAIRIAIALLLIKGFGKLKMSCKIVFT